MTTTRHCFNNCVLPQNVTVYSVSVLRCTRSICTMALYAKMTIGRRSGMSMLHCCYLLALCILPFYCCLLLVLAVVVLFLLRVLYGCVEVEEVSYCGQPAHILPLQCAVHPILHVAHIGFIGW